MASLSDISKLIESANSRLIALITETKTDLKTDIQQLTTSISNKLSVIDLDVKQVQKRCSALEDLAMRHDRRKELIVRNVPVLKDENVSHIAEKICLAIGFQSPYGVPVAFRLRGKQPVAVSTQRVLRNNNNRKEDKSIMFPPLLLKFATGWDTKAFMDRYFLHSSLKLLDIGFKTNERIYISENLTPANLAVFRLARELMKGGTVSKMRVSNGIVAVQLPGTNGFRSIVDILELQNLSSNSN